jgi:hypothetical protein
VFRRDDARRDASDTYGACNVLTRRRPRTFQSVVVVVVVVVVRVLLLHVSVSNAHRRKKEKKKTKEIIEIIVVVVVVSSSSSSKLESSRRGASCGSILFQKPSSSVFRGRRCDDTRDNDETREKQRAKQEQEQERERTIACFTGPNDPVLINFVRYHSILL